MFTNTLDNLSLKDTEGRVRYRFHFDCAPERFKEVTYEEIHKVHGGHILQKETDSIVNQEIRFFVWKRCRDWGYVIVPVCRKEERLYMGDKRKAGLIWNTSTPHLNAEGS